MGYWQHMKIILDITTYPFRGNGKYILIIGAILSVVSDIVSFAPTLGFMAGIILSGYFCAVYFDIINSSAVGDEEAPDFPEITSFVEDVMEPLLHVVAVAIASFAPWVAYLLLIDDPLNNLPAYYGLLAFGIIYFPMAMLAVVILGSLVGLSPHIVIPAIFRGGFTYWIAVMLLALLYAIQLFTSTLLDGHFIAGTLSMALIGMFTLMANGRMLGIFYRKREDQLDWI